MINENNFLKFNSVYADVVPALTKIKSSCPLYIYSSGSVAAQKLLFGYSDFGDLLPLFSDHFDTSNIGSKVEPSSYTTIATERLQLRPEQVLFVTDSLKEARAARSVGVNVLLSVRPGTETLPDDVEFTTIRSFDDIFKHFSCFESKTPKKRAIDDREKDNDNNDDNDVDDVESARRRSNRRRTSE